MTTTIPSPAPPGAAAAPAGPEPTARQARAGSAPARKRILAALGATVAASAALWLAAAQPDAAAATSGPQSATLVSASGPYTGSTGVSGLQSGLFLPGQLFIPVDPCLPPTLI
jgi:hypothetical protein